MTCSTSCCLCDTCNGSIECMYIYVCMYLCMQEHGVQRFLQNWRFRTQMGTSVFAYSADYGKKIHKMLNLFGRWALMLSWMLWRYLHSLLAQCRSFIVCSLVDMHQCFSELVHFLLWLDTVSLLEISVGYIRTRVLGVTFQINVIFLLWKLWSNFFHMT